MKITVETSVAAPIKAVWDAYTKPKHQTAECSLR